MTSCRRVRLIRATIGDSFTFCYLGKQFQTVIDGWLYHVALEYLIKHAESTNNAALFDDCLCQVNK